MFVTGRLVLLVALGVAPLVLFTSGGAPAWGVWGGWVLLCAVLTGLDVVLAADPRRVEITRTHPDRALRDEPVAGEIVEGEEGGSQQTNVTSPVVDHARADLDLVGHRGIASHWHDRIADKAAFRLPHSFESFFFGVLCVIESIT